MDNFTVCAEISTKDRYFTTLSLCIQGIILQTRPPNELIIYDDGEQKDLREVPLYNKLFHMLDRKGIKWEVRFGLRRGQIFNHQNMLDTCKSTFIWRIDDDCVPEPTCLENLLSSMKDDVGAVGGCVLFPDMVLSPPHFPLIDLEDIRFNSGNIQWFLFEGEKEVSQLYSTFLFRVKAGRDSGGYCMELSPCGHREESIFSHKIKRIGWKLIVNPKAVTWHYAEPTGGIRTYSKHPDYWANDEQIFQRKLSEWGVKMNQYKFIILDCGLGDTLMFLNILPEIKNKYGKDHKIVLAVCFPEVFQDEKDVTLISIAEAKMICANSSMDFDSFNVYKWAIGHGHSAHLIEAFRKLYL